MRKTLLSLSRCLFFTLLLTSVFTKSSYGQMVGDNIFLQGQFIEIGISPNGSFGSTVAAPTSYHPNLPSSASYYDPASATMNSSTRFLGFVADYARDGWTVGTPAYFGDFYLPGTPQEGWAIQVNGALSTAYFPAFGTTGASGYTGTLSGTNLGFTTSGSTKTGVWQGNGSGLQITQRTTMDTTKLFFVVNVVMKNTSSSTLNKVYYLRTVDADNEVTVTSNYNTVNTITHQLPSTDNKVLVSATGVTYTNAYLGLGTKDCRAKCSIFDNGLSPTYSISAIDSQLTPYLYTSGSTLTDDVGIALDFNLGNIAPGDSVSFQYTYILNASYIDSALNSLAITIAASADTICSGSSTIITASGATAYSWIPATGLSCTTCAAPVASPTTTTTYTVTGTTVSGCTVTDTIQVKVLPLPGSVITPAGTTTFCVGSSVVLNANTGTGYSYIWLNGASVISGATSSAYTATASGTYKVKITTPFGCTDTSAGIVVTVNQPPVLSPISGPSFVCTGSTITLSDTATLGAWSSSATGIATVNSSGVVTGVTPGTAVISYSKTNTCGTTNVTKTVTVGNTPTSAGTITGPASVCVGSTITLADTMSGGTWSSVFTSLASVSATGVVTGVASGVDTIKYTIVTSCGTVVSTYVVTVNTFPIVNAIAGANFVCTGASTLLTDATAGGTWSATNGFATISATGNVTGVTAGVDTINYVVSNSCGLTTVNKIITVYSSSGITPITGPTTVCVGSSIALANATAGGTWTTGNAAIASVNSTGTVTGVGAGTATISYTVTNPCGTFTVSQNITVSPAPNAGTITGPSSVCVGANITLADATTGGTWSSVFTTIATVSATGVVTGTGVGTDTIKYSVTNSCGTVAATKIITVNPNAAVGAITGPTVVCQGSSITLADTSAGGVWSSSNTAMAAVSTTGVVTGTGGGTPTISYTITNSCGTISAPYPITVNPLPNAGTITGTPVVCVGATNTLTNSATGGTWSSSNAARASISTTGTVTGIATGTAVISYSVTNSCGTATDTMLVTVNPAPNAGIITGTQTVCQGATTTLSDAAGGGTWTTGNAAIASVNATGIVTGMSGGSAIITYSVTNVCGTAADTALITVNPLPAPAAIGGSSTVCVGSSVTLTETSTGGTWSSDNTGIATVSTTGVVTGVSTGSATISYTMTNSCGTVAATLAMTINPAPSAGTISGPSTVCATGNITLTDATTGGVWRSGSAAIATVNTTGVVTGITAGTTLISYTVTNSCGTASTTASVTVSPAPNAGTITGPATVCQGANITLTDAITGGTWSSNNTAVATINGSGVVTGVSGGSATISYSVTGSCGTVAATYTVSVTPTPDAGTISGSTTVCVGATTTLASTVSGGTWTSAAATIASVNSATGVVSGVTAGSTTITYTFTNACGSATTTTGVTVNPAVSAGTITGAGPVCAGATITLADATSGGTWSSNNTAIATVDASGVVTGVSAGTAIISYSVTTACGTTAATASVTVNPLPDAGTISGPGSVCVGSGITLSTTATGGTWSATNGNALALSTGVVGGITAGIDTIQYTVTNSCGTSVASFVVTVGAPTSAGTLSGPATLCTGTRGTFTSTSTGGSWISSNSTIASINSSTGAATGLTAGTVTITYIYTTSCGSAISTASLTVNLTPAAGTISGPATVCAGAAINLTDATTGGTWSTSNTAVASVNTTGVVSGISAGTVVISYSVTNTCGTATATKNITVNALPDAGTITGAAPLCPAGTLTLSNTATGGVWSTSNAAVASVSSTGVVTATGIGTATITYTSTTPCGTAFTTTSITVNSTASAGTVTGPAVVCIGANITLTDAVSGGTWSSSNSAIASVNTTGTVTGISAGSAVISYTVTTSCGTAVATATVNVSAAPNAGSILGTTTICAAASTTLTSTGAAGGSWSTGNAAVASVNAATGVMTGVGAGATTITYTVATGCGSAFTTAAVTVNPAPSAGTITGPSIVCVGASITLSDATSGGIWSTSNAAVASVGASGGVTGTATGSAVISYSVTNSCGTAVATYTITVSNTATAGTISGPTTFCTGSTGALSSTVSGGAWSTSNAGIASISAAGIVTGVANGAATITYTVTTACSSAFTTYNITVGTAPSAGTISGPASVCTGATITLTDATSGGTWSSSNTAIASVDAAGNVTGVASGAAVISYSVTNSCGTATATKNVSVADPANAGTISGTTSLCVGAASVLSETAGGGVWSTSNAAIASVNSSGVVNAVSTGSATITYTVTTACSSAFTTTTITVNPAPAAGTITGTTGICVGATTTLSDAAAGGTWSTSNAAIASVDASGVVTGVSTGSAVISYSVTNSCGTATATTTVNVSNVANAGTISGTTTLCAGATATLTTTGTGGVWSTTNAAVASVDASGNVTAVSAGTATISYSVTTGCSSAATATVVTVNPAASAGTITGPSAICATATTLFTDAVAGGTWSSSNTAVATVDPATGSVTGIASGSATISYSVTNSCGTATAVKNITVNPLAVAGTITGTTSMCIGATTALADATSGGSWSSSNTAIASVNGSGLVFGRAAGTAVISYSVTNGCGTVAATTTVTVMPFPSAGVISGPGTACVGSTVTYVDTTTGGFWTTGNAAIATVDATGGVTGISPGTVNIYYNVTNACGATNVTISVTILNAPSTSIISGGTTICPGTTTVLTDTVGGGTWTSSDAAIATVSPSSGAVVTVTGISTGTAIISYTTSNACGTAIATAYVTVSTLPDHGIISGAASVCPGTSALLTESVSGGSWRSSDTAVATISATGLVTGITVGTTVISYSVAGTCGTSVATDTITVTAPTTPAVISGTTLVCLSSTSTLSASVAGGTWTTSDATVASVNSTGIVAGITAGTATISYTLSGACGAAVSTAAVTVSGIPYPGLISGATTVCQGATTALTESVTGGTWSSGNPGIASVTTTGIVTGIAPGTATISYTITTACGTGIATAFITVGPLPDPGTLSGSSTVCLGGTTTLVPSIAGGTWSSSDTAIASVNTTGTVTGIALGTATLSYGVTNSCGISYATAAVAVITAPATAGTISGIVPVCPGGAVTLTDTVSGGTWSSSDASIASVDAATGIMTGVSGGTATITYTVSNACGTAFTTAAATVNPGATAGVISGTTTTVCVGQMITLTDTVTGGTWSLSDTAVASVDTMGVVTGITPGTATLSYTTTGSCGIMTVTTLVTVNPIPDAGVISGPSSLCVGSAFTLTDTVAGGSWSSSDGSVATVDAAGNVTALATGRATISYSVSNVYGCINAATLSDTVLGAASAGTITGSTTTACETGSFVLYDTTAAAAGSWSIADTTVAVISSTGVVTGRAAGVTTVSYTVVSASGCSSVVYVGITVHPTPVVSPLSGPTSLCSGGGSVTLATTTTGGVWTSSNTAVATVDTTGILTPVGAGTTIISYSVTNVYGCVGAASQMDTIGTMPTVTAISGVSALCAGTTATFTDATTGGSWTSSDATVASVDASGVVTGVGAGTATISYTLGTGCYATATSAITINAAPSVSAITGTTTLCTGTTTTLTDATTGGTWSTSAAAVASVDASGNITAVGTGTATISYTVTSGGCAASATAAVTVNAMPSAGAISGPAAMCTGTAITFTDAVTGGTWTTSDATVASVDASGNVTAVAAGSAIISYTVTNSCGTAVATATVTVSAGPSAGTITGTTTLCAGTTTTLADAAGGGTWSSSDAAVAAVSSTGIVTGISAGTATISYTITSACGTVFATTTVTIDALPSAGTIGGPSAVCLSSAITLTETVSGGAWTTSNPAIASVSSAGVVTGITSGTVTITYTVTNAAGCTAFATYTVVSGGTITASIAPGGATLCGGSPVVMTVTSSATGLAYQWYRNGVLISGATSVTYSAGVAGNYSVVLTNGCATDTAGPVAVVNPPAPLISLVGSNTLATGSFAAYQWYRNGIMIPGATTSTYTYSTTGIYTVRVTDGHGCSVTSAGYTVTSGVNEVGSVVTAADIKMFPNPASEIITIEAPVKVNVSVFTMDGKIITTIKDATTIDVSNLPNAMYMIMVYDTNNTLIKTDKFVKMN